MAVLVFWCYLEGNQISKWISVQKCLSAQFVLDQSCCQKGNKMLERNSTEYNQEKGLKMVKNWWWELKKLWKIDDESGKNGEKLMMRVEPVADVRSGLLQSDDAAAKEAD